MTFNNASLIQHCRICGDDNPVDAAFCISCGQVLTRAVTGPTTYLDVLPTRSASGARATLMDRLRRQSKAVVIVALCLASLTGICSELWSARARLPITPPSQADGTIEITASANLQILVDGYLKAMGSKDFAIAGVFVANNLGGHEREALLGPEQTARLANIVESAVQVQGTYYPPDHSPNKGWATGYVQYRDCSFKHIEVEFVSEDEAWKIASLRMAEEQWLSEAFKRQACNDIREVQAQKACQMFEPPTAENPTGLSRLCTHR